MSPFRIGVVNFLNAFPLWGSLEDNPQVQLVRGVPSFLADELHAGRLDAALISSVEYLRHRDNYTFHPDLCIAATAESVSIRLFVPQTGASFRETLTSTDRVYTDAASRSSVAQLQVVLSALELTPELHEIRGAGERIAHLAWNEALLAIGDTALAHRESPSFDLQTEYHARFGHGFVYALWVCRSELLKALSPVLSGAYRNWTEHQQQLLKVATERFGFSSGFTHRYLTEIIQHRMTPDRLTDLEFFASKLEPMHR